jgi:hypothetical protein
VGGNAHPYRDSVGALEHGMIRQIATPLKSTRFRGELIMGLSCRISGNM